MSEYCMKCMMPLDGKAACSNCGFAGAGTHVPHQLAPGTMLLGRYLLGQVIGQGGFGITYIGRDLTLGIRVAIKEFFPVGHANRNVGISDSITVTDERNETIIHEGKARFLEEARVLAQFYGASGIVNVNNYFEANDTAYIVMEYLDGEDLRCRLKKGVLSADRVFELMRPVMNALQKVHDQGVVHRDISPDNIMLLKDGTMKLMDFGAARFIDYSDQRSVSVMLKSGYAPEEQYRARGEQGPWTDVYALCATIYKAITGITPDDALQRLYEDEIEWPSQLGIAITSQQEEALKKGMATRTADRFKSIDELKYALGFVDDTDVKADEVTVTVVDIGIGNRKKAADADTFHQKTDVVIDGERERGVPERNGDEEETVESGKAQRDEVCDGSERGDCVHDADRVDADSDSDSKLSPIKKIGIASIIVILIALAIAILPQLLVPPVYTVSFESGGGGSVAPVEITGGDQLEEPETPTRENYTFEGWYLDRDLTERVEFPVRVSSDLELYAAWEEILVNYTVKYLDDGTQEAVQDSKTAGGNSIGSTVIEEAPEIDGFVLVSDATQVLKVSASEKDNVISFRYKKLTSYIVNYVDQGSGAALADQKVVSDVLEGDSVTETAPEISGYALASESPQMISLGANPDGNVITFSYTKLTSYIVNYVDQGSGAALADQKVVSDVLEGDSVTETAPEISGYALASESPQMISLGANPDGNVITFSYTPIVVYQAPIQKPSSSKNTSSGSDDVHWDGGWD